MPDTIVEQLNSIPLITGLIHVTGEHDVGKTSFALECGADPSRICFFDSDVKGRSTVEQLRNAGVEFGAYHDLVKLDVGMRELEFHAACMKLIDGIQPGQYDAIIWDTWTRFAKTYHPYVLEHPSEFKLKWNPMGPIKGAQQWKEAQWYEAQTLNHLQTLAPIVIIVTHLKDFYLNDAKTGKQVPDASRTLARVPRFRIWLRHNPNSPVPIGLVLKRLDTKLSTPRGLRTVSILPRKIVPREDDASLWDTIGEYFENPVGLRKPTLEETPNEFELSILDGTLTTGQRHTLHLMLKANAVSQEEVESEELDTERIAELVAEGKTPLQIAQELGVDIPDVIRATRGVEK